MAFYPLTFGVPYDLRAKSERPPETLVDMVNQRTDVTVARLLFEEGLGHGKTPVGFCHRPVD